MLNENQVTAVLCYRYHLPFQVGSRLAKCIKEDSTIKGNKQFSNEQELKDYLDRMEELGNG